MSTSWIEANGEWYYIAPKAESCMKIQLRRTDIRLGQMGHGFHKSPGRWPNSYETASKTV